MGMGTGQKYKGHKQLRDLFIGTRQLFPSAQHLTGNHVIRAEGDRAHSICELLASMSLPENQYFILQGFYNDDLVKIDGKWCISVRKVRILNPEFALASKFGLEWNEPGQKVMDNKV